MQPNCLTTAEGGMVVSNQNDLSPKIEYMRRFGHKNKNEFQGLGINAKMSELHAALGLCNLPKNQQYNPE
jgi:dTDP-4-amino-4,6-dideoxygalactose transaminase